ncbi:Phosphoglycerate mutase (BPG-independent, AlkP superfamily) [Methanococcoides vulcani]|uniref:Phosphoglycerate mutase (BPG-independent, AlkP superfamily) n=1 Tax=Methanococcoides vulcani TaxID=1353158 RepID=A0A1I0B5N3_9EURY|nr:alkaline phosphatase family protein [Methanococcoides vulcani]SET02088.1 Phosphoglycerate mutase (BPG-independent, AlkP superfamily) [Methanococcoides vulcani]
MKNGPESNNICIVKRVFLVICFIVSFTAPPAGALTQIDVNPISTPDGAVILIIDGLGSSYIYPEITPYALDGAIIEKPVVRNISMLSDQGLRVLNVLTPSTEGENGHSVIVTGNSGATPAMVAYTDATIYDIAHKNGYFTLAILEKGDIPEILAEQDVVVHDLTTSINDPQMEVIVNSQYESQYESLQTSITEILEINAESAPVYVEQHPEGSIERYYAYNCWAMDTTIEVLDLMHESYPEQKFILTVNVGAVDTAGLYRRSEGYADTIEDLDIMIGDLYERTKENDLALILTSDHGMTFQSADGRGGSKSDQYASQPEVLRIPFIVTSKNLNNELLEGEFGQQDIAPTILSVLDLPDEMRFTNGRSLASKGYVNFKVILPETGTVTIYKGNEMIADAMGDDSYVFYGLEQNSQYNIRVKTAEEPDRILERTVFSDADHVIRFDSTPDVSKGSGDADQKGTRRTIGSVLIVLINLAGLGIIFRLIKK